MNPHLSRPTTRMTSLMGATSWSLWWFLVLLELSSFLRDGHHDFTTAINQPSIPIIYVTVSNQKLMMVIDG